MSFLPRGELPQDDAPLRAVRERLGFVPAVFRAQSLLPRVVEAEAALVDAVLLHPGALSWRHREEILVAVSAARRNRHCVAVHAQVLRSLAVTEPEIEALADRTWSSSSGPERTALLDFAVKVGLVPWTVGAEDLERLRLRSIDDAAILETVQTSALARFLCTVSTGLGLEAEFPLSDAIERSLASAPETGNAAPARRANEAPLAAVPLTPEAFPPFAFLKKTFGFVPRLYRAQTLRPETLEAQILALRDVLLTEDLLSRRQKEFLLLAVSGAHLDTYQVAVHAEILRGLGVDPQTADVIATDHRRADIPESDKTLLDFAVRLATMPSDYGAEETSRLSAAGLSDGQILEAIVMTGLAGFLDSLDAGLMPKPDFRPRRDLRAERTAAAAAAAARAEDPDAPLAARARAGDAEAFETLVRRHQALVYRTLVGLTGNPEDAEDGSQVVFVNAFRKIADFAGAARFSTWLTRIAINEGLERVRRRRPTESLDASDDDGTFRPSRLEAWIENPERLYAREEMRQIVRQELARLPLLYRAAVMLRDIEQLSTAEAAAALEVPEATLKTRLLRGRLMMREALAGYFSSGEKESGNA